MSILSKAGFAVLILLLAALAGGVWMRWQVRRHGAAARRERLSRAKDWVCYYGPDREILRRTGADCLVLEADRIGPPAETNPDGRIVLAYLSVGEVNEARSCWAELAGTSALAEAATAWPGSRRTDPRSPRWRRVVLLEAERRLALGYDGLFLDTLDQAAALETEDPEAFAGAARATEGIVRTLRRRHPEAFLVMNGGFALLEGVAAAVDAVAVEGLRFTHDGPGGRCRPRRADERAWLAVQQTRLRDERLPLFALEYVPESATAGEMARMAEAVRRLGARPALGRIDLTTWPPGIERAALAEATTPPGGG